MLNYINPLELASKIAQGTQLLKAGSLTELAKASRVEPIVLVDDTILHVALLPDLMQTLTSIVGGYYLQGIELVAASDIYGTQTLKILDAMNPNRDGSIAALAMQLADGQGTGIESYTLQLPIPGVNASVEEFGLEDNTKLLKEASNLAVGKMINVSFGRGDNKHTMPITIRLIPAPSGAKHLVDILSVNSQDNSAGERWHQYRSDSITLIGDLMFGMDRIRAHRAALLRDNDGHYQQIFERQRKNRIAAIASGKASLAAASNIYVVSSNTVRNFERETGLKLSNPKARERIFEDTYAMLLAEVDPNYNVVTIYHRDCATGGVYSAAELASANRSNAGNGLDVFKIFENFKQGNMPSL